MLRLKILSVNKPAGSHSTVLGQANSNRGFVSAKDRSSASIKCPDTGHRAPRIFQLCPRENYKNLPFCSYSLFKQSFTWGNLWTRKALNDWYLQKGKGKNCILS